MGQDPDERARVPRMHMGMISTTSAAARIQSAVHVPCAVVTLHAPANVIKQKTGAMSRNSYRLSRHVVCLSGIAWDCVGVCGSAPTTWGRSVTLNHALNVAQLFFLTKSEKRYDRPDKQSTTRRLLYLSNIQQAIKATRARGRAQ